ncbi:low molecular weight phosphotyrosine protein phosphatase [Vibrio aquaticus]|uniref:protein-tyrosine-phosphatase n=1 Tax=Vibrio aquaticus TaxID=2496559 RepID=A0A432D0H0_9VIBR|nr:low molecular weight protein-tyrosine-phosphatase [Vibrio aquaticus]RTZ17420.1 low molecular weight phosphotyrosine protein phosphatase [Vibrio aquaticus]
MINRILIVCSGNICRSPLAKAIFEAALPQVSFDSAGLLVENSHLSGSPAAVYSQERASLSDLCLSEHRAKQLTQELVDWSDLILVMSHSQMDMISQIADGARGKAHLIGQWIGVGDIPDPIGKEFVEFDNCYRLLDRAVGSWKVRLHGQKS